MLITLLANGSVAQHEFVPAGQTVNDPFYVQFLKRLKEAIRRKCPAKWHGQTITTMLLPTYRLLCRYGSQKRTFHFLLTSCRSSYQHQIFAYPKIKMYLRYKYFFHHRRSSNPTRRLNLDRYQNRLFDVVSSNGMSGGAILCVLTKPISKKIE